MTNLEKQAIQCCANELKRLASLKNCGYPEEIKNRIKPYMMWFDMIAYELEEIIELTDKKGFVKKYGLEDIIKHKV